MFHKSFRCAALAVAFVACLAAPLSSRATEVVINTAFGLIEVDLTENATPLTVANFMGYVRDGAYDKNLIHRSVPTFIFQSGSYVVTGEGQIADVETGPPVRNEFGASNVRGTIAMAKLGGNPDSATSGWFINLADNSTILDDQNGGFTVFGRVREADYDVLDAIEAVQTWRFAPPFSEIPLRNFNGGGQAVTADNFLLVSISELSDFDINAGLNDAWYNQETDGQGFFINVFPEIGQLFISWFTFEDGTTDTGLVPNLGAASHRWFTASGPFDGNRAELTLYTTRGGVFDSGSPSPVTSESGRIELIFANCNLAELYYELPEQNLADSIRLTRVANDNIALCEALAED